MRSSASIALTVLTVLFGAPVAGQADTPVRARYSVYAAGLDIADVDAGFRFNAQTYRVELALRTTGVLGWVVRGDTLSTADGTWRANRSAPSRFHSHGTWRGEPRLSLIDYERGQPLVRQLVPPNEAEREPVPPEIQANSINSLSAMAELMRAVRTTGRCEGSARVFDGRRASEVTARTVGVEILPTTSRSIYAGPALRCDFEGQMLAGFWLGSDRQSARKPTRGSAWLAEVVPAPETAPTRTGLAGPGPTGMKVPVRITFESRWLGDVTLHLTSAVPSTDGRVIVR